MREGTAKAIVAFGSNIERERNLPEAIRLLTPGAPHHGRTCESLL